MFKKLLLIIAVSVCAASCFDDGPSYKSSYTLYTHFDRGISFGSDSLFFEPQNGLGIFWDNVAFYHKLNEGKTEFQGGFIISRLNGRWQSETADDRFRVNSGTGLDGSLSYAVYYENPDKSKMPEKDIEFVAGQYGSCKMLGCYVNNTKEVYNAIVEKFQDSDKLSIKMTGYKGGAKTDSQEFVLAEYTEQKDSVVTAWTYFELAKLGYVETVDIEIVCNRDDIPAAFCMDSMMAGITIEF